MDKNEIENAKIKLAQAVQMLVAAEQAGDDREVVAFCLRHAAEMSEEVAKRCRDMVAASGVAE